MIWARLASLNIKWRGQQLTKKLERKENYEEYSLLLIGYKH